MDRAVAYHLQRAASGSAAALAPPLALAEPVRRLTAALRKVHAAKAVRVRCDIAPALRVRLDEGDATEALGNLLDNAFKWCQSRIRIGARRESGLVVLWVEDDGPGITAEQARGLGERGARVDLTAPGHGIGLAVAREICEAYGGDLTIASFAYLRGPLMVAGAAFLIGAIGAWLQPRAAMVALALMSVVFLNAARLALITFDPYLASRPLAEALARAPEGTWIADNQYYTFSSIFFYTNKRALLLNGRVNNLEYGSYAPGAPQVFINDAQFKDRWLSSQRHYLTIEKPSVQRIEKLIVPGKLIEVKESGGKFLYTNLPL
jgi:hypothetical protein